MPATELQPEQVEIARVYARSLVDLADSAGKTDEVGDEMAQVSELIAQQPDLRVLLEHPALSDQERLDAVRNVFTGKVSELTMRFLGVVGRRRRLPALGSIARAVTDLLAERRGEVTVEAVFANEPSPERIESLMSRMGAALGGRSVQLESRVDPALLGGVRLRVGDQLIDGSVASALARVRRTLAQAGRNAGASHE
ncbi:MAG: ATP synthase F1 subunit delta [Planctomycetota bacterium]